MKKSLIIAIVLSFAAGLAAAPSARKYIHLPLSGDFKKVPYSDGVLVGDSLFIAGRIGVDPATQKAPADLDLEIKTLLDGYESVLKEADMTMDDLVSVQIYCTDLTLYDRFNTAYRVRFKKDFPARAFLGAGSILRGGHFEMVGVAIKQ